MEIAAVAFRGAIFAVAGLRRRTWLSRRARVIEVLRGDRASMICSTAEALTTANSLLRTRARRDDLAAPSPPPRVGAGRSATGPTVSGTATTSRTGVIGATDDGRRRRGAEVECPGRAARGQRLRFPLIQRRGGQCLCHSRQLPRSRLGGRVRSGSFGCCEGGRRHGRADARPHPHGRRTKSQGRPRRVALALLTLNPVSTNRGRRHRHRHGRRRHRGRHHRHGAARRDHHHHRRRRSRRRHRGGRAPAPR